MIWLLGGYMWLYVHRPFEVWPALGAIQLERGYMLVMLLAWVVAPSKGFVPNRVHAAMAFFSLSVLAAWVFSPYAGHPGCTDVVENFVKVTVFYCLVVTTVKDQRNLRLLVLMFLASVGLYMAHSIWEFLHGRYQWRMGTRRMIGIDITFSDPNAFASTLLYALPLILPFWNEQPRRVPRWALLGFAASACFCILMTGSRAGFTGMCLLGLILFVTSAKQKFQAVMLAGFAAVAALLFLSVALPEDLQNRYLTLVDSSRGPENAQVSANGRLDGFMWGIYVWSQSPLFGYGPASFAFSTGRGGQAHNLYGQVLSEMGIVGALALVSLLVCFLLNWRESRRQIQQTFIDPKTDFAFQLSKGVTIVVVLLLVMGWAGHNLFRYNWQWFAAFGAIAVHCLRRRVADLASQPHVPDAWHRRPGQGCLLMEG